MKTIRAADLFCGAGGTSSGLLDACNILGHRLDLLAVNHWPVAIETHTANHPYAEHLCESLDVVDPRKVVPSGKLDLLVASPECTHHSNARGGKPMSDQGRASGWHVARWAEALRVDNILIENVREFRDWGPLDRRGRPIARRKGELYGAFLNTLRAMGYAVEDRILNAADYGDPTSRKRLFIMARKGSRRVAWPNPTHSAKGAETLFGSLPAYRTAREIINWQSKGASIFGRKKPLSPNTMRRILAGLRKFSGLPFVLPDLGYYRNNQPQSLDKPLGTITASRGAGHLVEPFIVGAGGPTGAGRPQSVDEPLGTILAEDHRALIEPFLVTYHQEKNGGAARVNGLDEPLPTLDTSNRYGLAQPFLVPYHRERAGQNPRGHSVDEPLPVVATSPFGLVEPYVVKLYGTSDAAEIDAPLPTVTGQGNHLGLAQAFIVQAEHTGEPRVHGMDMPMPTITSKAHFGLVEPYLVQYNGTSDAQPLDEPLGTVTGVDRFGLCIPIGDGYAVVDILFRMLEPGELARAHSLDDYEFTGTKRDVVKQIGNSVPRSLARALCLAILN